MIRPPVPDPPLLHLFATDYGFFPSPRTMDVRERDKFERGGNGAGEPEAEPPTTVCRACSPPFFCVSLISACVQAEIINSSCHPAPQERVGRRGLHIN